MKYAPEDNVIIWTMKSFPVSILCINTELPNVWQAVLKTTESTIQEHILFLRNIFLNEVTVCISRRFLTNFKVFIK